MIIEQLSVFLENRAGTLSEITGVLSENGIDLLAINIAETADYGVLRMVVQEIDRAESILNAAGFVTKRNHVVAASVTDAPGGLHALLSLAAKASIDIQYMYSVFGKVGGRACMILRTGNAGELDALLEQNGFQTDYAKKQ